MVKSRRYSRAVGYSALLVGVGTVAGWIYVLSTPWADGEGFAAGLRALFAMVSITSGVVAAGCGLAVLAVERFLAPASTERKLLAGGTGILAAGVLGIDILEVSLWLLPWRTTVGMPMDLLYVIGLNLQFLGFVLTVAGLLLVVASTRRDGHTPPGRTLVRISGGMVLFGLVSLVLTNGIQLLGWWTIGSLLTTLGWLSVTIGVPTLVVGGLLAVIARWRGSPAA